MKSNGESVGQFSGGVCRKFMGGKKGKSEGMEGWRKRGLEAERGDGGKPAYVGPSVNVKWFCARTRVRLRTTRRNLS